MTVRAGREFLAVPGPTNIPDEVLQAMHRPAVEIYSEPLIALTDGLLRDLGKVFATATRPYIYIANGHGAWEAALTNVLSRGDKILVLESGQFAMAWGDAAARLGVEMGTTAPDGSVTLEPVYCLGLCAVAPSAMLNGRLIGRLDQARLDALLAEAQQ